MSYESTNMLSPGTKLKLVRELIALLGYISVNDKLKVPNRKYSMMWFDDSDYKSWAGVELSIYKEKERIIVTTRSRTARSYWDLIHQNRTIKLLKDLFGGSFVTDEGRNRYAYPSDKPPSPISSGCYLARWRFHNALMFPFMYMPYRPDGQNARPDLTGLELIDSLNPRFFANALLIPYLTAIWEEYFRSTFVVLLRYSEHRQSAIKKARLTHHHLESIASGELSIEQAIAESLSFQRPSNIVEHFNPVEPNLDIMSPLRKPYRRRKKNLFCSVEEVVETRNQFVHSGEVGIHITDNEIDKIKKDFEVAVDRTYEHLGQYFEFKPIRNF